MLCLHYAIVFKQDTNTRAATQAIINLTRTQPRIDDPENPRIVTFFQMSPLRTRNYKTLFNKLKSLLAFTAEKFSIAIIKHEPHKRRTEILYFINYNPHTNNIQEN